MKIVNFFIRLAFFLCAVAMLQVINSLQYDVKLLKAQTDQLAEASHEDDTLRWNSIKFLNERLEKLERNDTMIWNYVSIQNDRIEKLEGQSHAVSEP
jgi:hypothetical protein